MKTKTLFFFVVYISEKWNIMIAKFKGVGPLTAWRLNSGILMGDISLTDSQNQTNEASYLEYVSAVIVLPSEYPSSLRYTDGGIIWVITSSKVKTISIEQGEAIDLLTFSLGALKGGFIDSDSTLLFYLKSDLTLGAYDYLNKIIKFEV